MKTRRVLNIPAGEASDSHTSLQTSVAAVDHNRQLDLAARLLHTCLVVDGTLALVASHVGPWSCSLEAAYCGVAEVEHVEHVGAVACLTVGAAPQEDPENQRERWMAARWISSHEMPTLPEAQCQLGSRTCPTC